MTQLVRGLLLPLARGEICATRSEDWHLSQNKSLSCCPPAVHLPFDPRASLGVTPS